MAVAAEMAELSRRYCASFDGRQGKAGAALVGLGSSFALHQSFPAVPRPTAKSTHIADILDYSGYVPHHPCFSLCSQPRAFSRLQHSPQPCAQPPSFRLAVDQSGDNLGEDGYPRVSQGSSTYSFLLNLYMK